MLAGFYVVKRIPFTWLCQFVFMIVSFSLFKINDLQRYFRNVHVIELNFNLHVPLITKFRKQISSPVALYLSLSANIINARKDIYKLRPVCMGRFNMQKEFCFKY